MYIVKGIVCFLCFWVLLAIRLPIALVFGAIRGMGEEVVDAVDDSLTVAVKLRREILP